MFYKNYIIGEYQLYKNIYLEINDHEYVKVRYKKTLFNKKCIIWIPGRNDYFFHYHFTNLYPNYDIYALSMRNNHSRRSDVYNHIDDVNNHKLEIDVVYDYFSINNYDEVILYGHSTGGLICILYNKINKKNKISKMILNSPFLRFKRHWIENFFLNWIGWFIFDFVPNINISFDVFKPNLYSINLSKRFKINPWYKTFYNVPVVSSWLINIMKYQHKISLGLFKIQVPTLILYCNKSKSRECKYGDCVLDISENLKQVPKLFNNTKSLNLYLIEDSVHDVLCSEGDVDNNQTVLGKVCLKINKFIEK